MAAISASGGVTGSNKHAFLRISNRHAMFDASLNSALLAYHRQLVITNAAIDYERKELKLFLKKIYHCGSDKDPFAKKYLQPTYLKALKTKDRPMRSQSGTLPEIEQVLKAQTAEAATSQSGNRRRAGSRRKPAQALPPLISIGVELDDGPKLTDMSIPTVSVERSKTLPADVAISTLRAESPKSSAAHLSVKPNQDLQIGGGTPMGRRRSHSKLEVDLIEQILEEKHRRDRLKLMKIDDQVKYFCERMEEFKQQQITQGNITQTPKIF